MPRGGAGLQRLEGGTGRPPDACLLLASSGCLLAAVVIFTAGAGLGLGGGEGVGDALVGGISLAVDAVGVDLEQDSDAVPGAAGDLGRRHPGVQPQRHRRVPQVVCWASFVVSV